jgi:hypothetical protein
MAVCVITKSENKCAPLPSTDIKINKLMMMMKQMVKESVQVLNESEAQNRIESFVVFAS